MVDPRSQATILGSSIVISAIMYIVTTNILTNQNISGGLWDVGTFLISVVPVAAAILFLFR